jgi:hypothetical protein
MAWIYRARASVVLRHRRPSCGHPRRHGVQRALILRHPYGRKRFHDFQTIALNTCNFAELDSIRRFRQTAALSR